MLNVIKHRLDIWQIEPIYWEHMAGIEKRIYASSVARSLFEIIKIRASQINKCVFCIDYHTHEALKHGETNRRIFALSAWQESPLFNTAEKSALQLAEQITHISIEGVTDACYDELKLHFSQAEIADLIICICHINFLNRIGITTKTVAL